MVSFEIFVKAMPPSLSELKVLPNFCFAFKIPDDVTVTNMYILFAAVNTYYYSVSVNLKFRRNKILQRILWETIMIYYQYQ